MNRPDDDVYTPERVRYYLAHWRELVEMSQGTSNGLFARSTGGTNGRFTFAIIIADLHHAADCLPVYWQSTELIFRRQRRSFRRCAPPTIDPECESPIPSQALDDAIYRMARALGYSPIAQSAA